MANNGAAEEAIQALLVDADADSKLRFEALRADVAKFRKLVPNAGSDVVLCHMLNVVYEVVSKRFERVNTSGYPWSDMDLAEAGFYNIAQVQIVCSQLWPMIARRLDKLEGGAKGFKYRGTWVNGATYSEGHFCTDDGSLWHCERATQTRPGLSRDWTLCVKRGRDAKGR